MKKIILYAAGGILMTLICLCVFNPSMRAFKEYAPEVETKIYKTIYKRVANYLIFSKFEKLTYEIDEDGYTKLKYYQSYTGLMGNFWKED